MLEAARAEAVARSLQLELPALRICLLCLYGVAAALESGDEREVRRAIRFFAPLLWEEGLAPPVRSALERARAEDVPDAAAALAELDQLGPSSRVVKAVVRDLAAQQLLEIRSLLPPNGSRRR